MDELNAKGAEVRQQLLINNEKSAAQMDCTKEWREVRRLQEDDSAASDSLSEQRINEAPATYAEVVASKKSKRREGNGTPKPTEESDEAGEEEAQANPTIRSPIAEEETDDASGGNMYTRRRARMQQVGNCLAPVA